MLFSDWPERVIIMILNTRLLTANTYRSILMAINKCPIAVLGNQNTQVQLWTHPSNKNYLKCLLVIVSSVSTSSRESRHFNTIGGTVKTFIMRDPCR